MRTPKIARLRPAIVTARYTVAAGQVAIGHVLEVAGRFEARSLGGELLGVYPTRGDAAGALPAIAQEGRR